MDKLSELAERCEQATGPDRELDALIYWHSGIGPSEHPAYAGRRDVEALGAIFGRDPRKRPEDLTVADVSFGHAILTNYTASLDAAMTLVPEGWRIGNMGETVIEGNDPWSVRLLQRRFDGRGKRAEGDAATLALALCAASIRARATLSDSSVIVK